MTALFLAFRSAQAQDTASPEREEIAVGLSLPGVGSWVIPVLIDEEENIFLPVVEVFSLLRIRTDASAAGAILDGRLPGVERTYHLDAIAMEAEIEGEEKKIGRDELIFVEGRLFLRSDLFGKLFGLHCPFNFRSLDIRVDAEYELPAIREIKREKARQRLHSLTQNQVFDRRVENRGSIIDGGVIDWAIIGNVDDSGRTVADYAFNLGAELLGGGLTAGVLGSTDTIPGPEDIVWNWHRVDNQTTLLRQIRIGHITGPRVEGLEGTPVGLELTNRSTISPLSYGTYRIENTTEPGWEVELYVDNQLIDFTTSDEFGHYRFEIPVGYGSTPMELRFYGPWGEEKSMATTIRIPHTFLPAGQFDYTVSTGLLTGEGRGAFVEAEGTIGLGSFGTVGTGIIGLHDVSEEKGMNWHPYFNGTFRLSNSFFLSADYGPDSKIGADLSWSVTERVHAEAGYERRPTTDSADTGIADERYAVSLSTPVALGPLRGTVRGEVIDNVREGDHTFNSIGTFGTRLFSAPTTFTLRADWNGTASSGLTALSSTIRSTWRTWGDIYLRPSIELDWKKGEIAMVGAEIERRILAGLRMNLSAIRNTVLNTTAATVSLRWDMPFARTGTSFGVQNGEKVSRFEASGSIAYDSDNGNLSFANRGGLDRATVTVHPFLDINNNGQRDSDEPAVAEADVAVNGGLIRRSPADSTISVLNLEAHRPCILTFGEAGLPEISWRPKYRTMEVTPRPNRNLVIELPIVVGGEASGHVSRNGKGKGGVIVRFRQIDGTFADSTITYEDGEFYYMGLPPGEYEVEIDAEQIRMLGFTNVSAPVRITVRAGREGDIVEGIELSVGG